MQRPGIEPGPPAWQARILPLNQRCLNPKVSFNEVVISLRNLLRIMAKQSFVSAMRKTQMFYLRLKSFVESLNSAELKNESFRSFYRVSIGSATYYWRTRCR